jgi:hypothetical protein
MERSPRAKVSPFLLVHRNLRDAFDLILHRVFDRNDLVFVVLDLANRRIKGGGFAGARGASHQDHPVRLFDVAPELDQVGIGKAHHFER